MNKEEELLIKRAQRGNLPAFDKLVRIYDAKVMKVIYDMTDNVEDAHDIYQEIFIKVFKSINKFRFESEFFAWLFRIVVNSCISFHRKKRNYQIDSLEEYMADDNKYWKIISENSTRNPEQQLLNAELNNEIQISLNKLVSKQRAVFILKHYHGYKLREIAAILDCAEGTVKNYLFRATNKLKKSLQSYQKI